MRHQQIKYLQVPFDKEDALLVAHVSGKQMYSPSQTEWMEDSYSFEIEKLTYFDLPYHTVDLSVLSMSDIQFIQTKAWEMLEKEME